MLVAGMILLATGFVFQLRANDDHGGIAIGGLRGFVGLFVNVLEDVQTAAIWMMIGGAVIVGTAIGLSIYRDRLLTLPDKVRRREGVFRVLSWR